jgi:MFS family permease
MGWVAASLATIFVLSTLPTPLYESYRQAFGFSEITLTLIYAAYVVGTVTTMFFLGRLSDEIGRRPVVLVSLLLATLSTVLFLLARSTVWLLAGRITSGLGIALASGAATAWILELHPRKDEAAGTQIALAANTLGLAIGPLAAGVLAEFAPAPLRLSYLLFLPLVLAAAVPVWLSEETIERPTPLARASLRPRLGVPKEIRGEFVTPAIAAFVTFAVLGFYSALLPSVVSRSLHDSSRALSGGVVAELFLVGVVTIATWPRIDPRTGMLIGLVLLIPGVGLLVAAEAVHSMVLLWVSTTIAGVASGLGYRFGLQRVNEVTPEDRRSEVISSYLIVCYAGVSLPVIGVGVLASVTDPLLADTVFGGLIVLLALAALVGEARHPRRAEPRGA